VLKNMRLKVKPSTACEDCKFMVDNDNE